MKKIIIFIFILSTFVSFSQENEFNKKHNLLIDFGINHSRNFKPEYHPAFEMSQSYYNPETLYPGYYSNPVFNSQVNLSYQYYFYKKVNIISNVKFSLINSSLFRDIDSVAKYYFYPDSVTELLGYSPIPLYKETKTVQIGLNFMLGYRYKRFNIEAGFYFPFFNNIYVNREYEKNNFSHLKFTEFNYFSEKNVDIKFKYLIIKNKIPVSLYIEYNKLIFAGILFNLTKIKY
ncbi:MAG: hypothetical protein DRI94_07090 [Bacteroidetes bacterium]|nr:MAG: hypothetical protein DRI94_07090 [Bacteroidota bacterium]